MRRAPAIAGLGDGAVSHARVQSKRPSANRFYRIFDPIAAVGSDDQVFRDRVISLTGIRA